MKIVFRLCCFFLAVSLSSLMFFCWTESGLQLLLRGITQLSTGAISYTSAKGALFTSFQVENFTLKSSSLEMRCGRIESSWQPKELFDSRLHIVNLLARDVEILLLEEEAGSGNSDDIILPALAMPLFVSLDTLTVENFLLLDTDSSELTRIDHLSFGLAVNGSLFKLTDIQLDAPGYEGSLQGALDTGKDWYVELAGDVVYRDYDTGPFAGTISLKGPLGSIDAVIDLQQPTRGHLEGKIKELPNNFRWSAELQLHDAQLANAYPDLPEMLFTVSISAEGEMASYGGKLTGNLDYLFFKDVAVEAELYGNEDQIVFTEVVATNEKGRAHLTDGLLSWKDDLLWRGHLELQDVDPSLFSQEYPGSISLILNSSGSYGDVTGLVVDGDFQDVSGNLRGYDVSGHGRLNLDPHSIRVTDVQLQSGKALLKVNGRARSASGLENWQETLNWTAALQFTDFDPALFFAEYPGRVNGEVKSGGSIREGIVRGSADIVSVTGELRGYPLHGKGTVRVADETFFVDDLQLQSGQSVLKVGGQVTETVDATVSLNSPDIGEFIQGGKGKLKLDGVVSGNRIAPRFDVKVSASGMSYEDVALDSMQVDLLAGMDRAEQLSVKIKGRGLHSGSYSVDSLEGNLDGLLDKHRFSVQLNAAEAQLRVQGSGTLHDDYSWAGTFQDSRVFSPLVGTWRQNGISTAGYSAEKAFLEPFCLKSGGESICLSGDWMQNEQRWSSNIRWQQFDLARLSSLLSMPNPVQGRSDAELFASGSLDQLLSAGGFVKLVDAGLEMDNEDPAWDLLRIKKADLKIDLKERQLHGDMAILFADGSTIGVATQLSGVGPFAADFSTLGLSGTIDADLRNVEIIEPLTNYFIRPSGALKGKLGLSGSLAKPLATGKLGLADGQLELPELGISLSDVLFELQGAADGIQVVATTVSGPGNLVASGNLLFGGNGVSGDFHITGENFDTAMLPEYEIRTNPDLQFLFDGEGGKLTGQVTVPYALIAPEKITDSLGVSEDVVFVDEDSEQKATGWKFATSVRIIPGDDVRIEGYGLSGKIHGNLVVEKEPGTFMTGRGQLNLVDGMLSVYGRKLSIERSRVMFTGGPIDNPGVDVRAKKRVADKTNRNETIEVGVEVSGTVDDLQFTLFSNPPLEDSDILAYMMVGQARSDVGEKDESMLSSAAMALGLGDRVGVFDDLSKAMLIDEMYMEGGLNDEVSLVVGKHITEDLFLGYGHNFFNQQGEFRVRYDLGKGFSVESRSSGDATGADLLYSFEK